MNNSLDNDKRKNNDRASEEIQVNYLVKSLSSNLFEIKKILGESSDLVIRNFSIKNIEKAELAILYTDGLVDNMVVQEVIIKTLMIDLQKVRFEDDNKQLTTKEILEKQALAGGIVKVEKKIDTLVHQILSGNTVILIDGYEEGFTVGTKGAEHRGVEEPTSQTVVRGSKEGFNEILRTNTALLRRKIKSPNLRIEECKVGVETQTDIAILHMENIANEKIVQEVKERLKKIEIDGVLESGYVEEFIQDETYTPFPTVFNSERPDVIAAGLLEGRIAIIVDGTPFVLMVPALFCHFMQSSEDYYQRADIAIAIRILRYIALGLALLVPSFYIAITTFHQEMLPTTLLVSLAAQREGVPFPAVVEATIMEFTFEILREAGIRMPRAIGSAISIVGALVLGQAAVEAGIVSAVMVIVVSLTAISSFVIPEYNLGISVRLLRFCFMILAATFGLFGIITGLIVLVSHLTSLRSFGVPYLSPFAPLSINDQKDTILRFPRMLLRTRPVLIGKKNIKRSKAN